MIQIDPKGEVVGAAEKEAALSSTEGIDSGVSVAVSAGWIEPCFGDKLSVVSSEGIESCSSVDVEESFVVSAEGI